MIIIFVIVAAFLFGLLVGVKLDDKDPCEVCHYLLQCEQEESARLRRENQELHEVIHMLRSYWVPTNMQWQAAKAIQQIYSKVRS